MASVSTKLETITTTSTVSEVMNLIVEKMNDPEREKLSHWMKPIEEYAEKIIRNLTPVQLKRRKMDVVAAAALYDAFLEFESRTSVGLGLPLMHEALGRSQCNINTTWKKLFDNRGSLRGEELDVVYVEKDGSIADAIPNVVQALTNAVDGITPVMKMWLENIRIEAVELSRLVSPDIKKNYDTLTAAVAIIYATIQRHHGKMQVRIAQRDLSLLSATSPALISKCWIELLENHL
ncbi:hypothetical protein EU528_03845 [Candidatus Thorarchaeota archaeon]|nr:MAG: hypothetical protein EU528_03845 [Candidatus Thorarchaeota archaeon]